jgi:uncharacterized protein (TIGR02145 family)
MKKINLTSQIIGTVVLGVYLSVSGCKEDNNNGPIPTLPVLTTSVVSDITGQTASCGGNITSDGGDTVSARGVCWSSGQTPTTSDSFTTDSSGTGSFTSQLAGLVQNTPYFVRAYATNSAGTAYGDEKTFTTQQVTEIDIDGNIYKTVTIGAQTWFAENLKVTRYRNGNQILKVTDNMEWSNQPYGAYCWYDNDSATYEDIFGKLYNWNAVNDSRGLCPTGWHVPSDAEWSSLTTFLGGEGVAGGKLKDTTTTFWQSPNLGATNESGFTSLPGGERMADGTFQRVNYFGYWWSSSMITTVAYRRSAAYNDSKVGRNYTTKETGLSVRCLRD